MDIVEFDCEDGRYPERLLRIKNFPSKLYAVGNIELLKSEYTVGIVGSRKCSEYGRKVAYEFARDISRSGICVVSGMAIGIDGQAHNGATLEVGKTIAVLGSGFNHIYPKENEWLFHKILENCGCIVSEYAPDVEPDTKKFPKRNRIISGLSDSVLVVEAEYRSGTSITVRYAKEQGKKVYAIPNNIYAGVGLGTNMMIQDGVILALRANEIIEDLKNNENVKKKKKKRRKLNYDMNNLNNVAVDEKEFSNEKLKEGIKIAKEYIIDQKLDEWNKIDKEVNNSEENNQRQQIDKSYLPIYKLLSDNAIHINELARELKVSIQEITPIMTMMEIDGYAYQTQTNYFVRRE